MIKLGQHYHEGNSTENMIPLNLNFKNKFSKSDYKTNHIS